MRLFIIISVLCFSAVLTLFFINPSPITAKGVLLFIGLAFFLFAKEKYLIYISMFMVLCPVHLRYVSTTSNGIILILVFILFFRSAVAEKSLVSFEKIIKNPFFIPSLLILFSYLLSWMWAALSQHKGMSYNTEFLISIFCTVVLSNIIIGFVDSKVRLKGVQNVLLAILLLNMTFALATIVKPGLKFVLFSTSGSIDVGSGTDQALRLGGLAFRWEAYAEYLMMTVVFLTGILTKIKETGKYKYLIIALLFLSLIELLLTNTRGAIIASLLGISLIILFFTKVNPLHKTLMIIGIFLFIAMAAYFAESTGYLHLKERFQNFSTMVKTKYGPMPKARAGAWAPTMDQIVKDRFMGHGPSFYPLTGYEGGFGRLAWPHNLTLLIFATVGIYGFLAYCFLFFRFFALIRKIPKIFDKYSMVFYKSLWIAMLMFFIDAQKFDGALRQPTAYFYFIWMIIALLFTSYNMALNNQN